MKLLSYLFLLIFSFLIIFLGCNNSLTEPTSKNDANNLGPSTKNGNSQLDACGNCMKTFYLWRLSPPNNPGVSGATVEYWDGETLVYTSNETDANGVVKLPSNAVSSGIYDLWCFKPGPQLGSWYVGYFHNSNTDDSTSVLLSFVEK